MTIKEFNEYIENHKKLWHRIAYYLYMEPDYNSINIAKAKAMTDLYRMSNTDLSYNEFTPINNCFVCSCAYLFDTTRFNPKFDICGHCPIEWCNKYCFVSEYAEIESMILIGDFKRAAVMADKIAELPINEEIYQYLDRE